MTDIQIGASGTDAIGETAALWSYRFGQLDLGKQALDVLVITLGIVITVAFWKQAEVGETVFTAVWFTFWEGPVALLLINSTSWWALLALLWALPGFTALGMLGF